MELKKCIRKLTGTYIEYDKPYYNPDVPYTDQYVHEQRIENFKTWDEGALQLFSNEIERLSSEADERKNQIFNRSGALLSLSGVVLSMIAMFCLNNTIDDITSILMEIGIGLILVSSIIIGWILIPSFITVLSSTSGDVVNGKEDYIKHKKSKIELMATILADRLSIVEKNMAKLTYISTWMGHGIVLLSIGLLFIGMSLINILCEGIGDFSTVVITILLSIFVFVILECKNISKRSVIFEFRYG